MPKVPQFTANGGAAVYQAPRVGSVGDNPLGSLPRGFNSLSNSLGDIAARLSAQKDDLEFASIKGEYDAQVQFIRKGVLLDPNIESPFEDFNLRAQDLQDSTKARIKSPAVARAFDKHLASTFPEVQRDAMDDALKLQNNRNIAKLNEIGDTLSTTAAEGDPGTRDRAVKEYNDLVTRAEGTGTLSATQAYDAKKLFRQTVMVKNMDVIGRTDPVRLFELDQQGAFKEVETVARLKILESARQGMIHADAVMDRQLAASRQENENYYGFLANSGAIPDSEMDQILAGQHPYITNPELARTLKRVQDNPVGSKTSPVVESIMLDYHSTSMVDPAKGMEAIASARARLNHYRLNMTRRDPALDKAFNELQTDERAMLSLDSSIKGQARSARTEERAVVNAERGVRAEERTIERDERAAETAKHAQIMRDIRSASELYRMNSKPRLPGFIGTIQKAKEISDLNEISQLIRSGLGPKEAVDMVKQKRSEANKEKDPRIQDDLSRIQELAR